MASLPVIFDISSDDESVPDEIRGVEDFGWTEPKSKDEDWLLKLLEVADKHSDDSDEVVVVAEFNPTKKISKSKSCKTTLKDSDDDCVILDGDPDNSVASLNDSVDGSDEILIVAEKGQIACRDFPHSRHLCGRFPFISTPHEKHCDLCHCYVCDTIAPCQFWHGGFPLVEHCHATDKEPMWKEQRIRFRKENQGSISIALPQVNQRLHHDPPIQMTKNSSAGSCFSRTNQVSQSTKVQHCSSNNIASSTIRNHGVQQLSVSSKNIIQLSQASHHQPRVENPSIQSPVRKLTQRDKGNSFSSLPAKFVTSSAMFKRTGAVGGAAQFNQFPSYRNKSTNTSQYVINPPSVTPPLSAVSDFGDPSGWHDSLPSVIAGSYSENAARSGCPSLVETNSHSLPPINDSQISHQYQNQSDNSNWSSVQPQNPIQSANKNIYQQGNPNQICQQEISSELPNHNSFQHGNQIKDASDASPDLSFDWSSDYSLNNQPLLSGSCQIIVSESRHGRLDVKESDSDLTGNIHAPVNVQSVSPGQDWLCGLNILSPPASSLDVDMIVFDFETSWNDIAEWEDAGDQDEAALDLRNLAKFDCAEEADSALQTDSTDDPSAWSSKRPRLAWTPQLHKRFVDVVAQLGIKSAVPKTIMQLMNVDGLTREKVASHLQKYRLYLKRMQGFPNDGPSSSDQLLASTPLPNSLKEVNSGANSLGNGHILMPILIPYMLPPMMPMPVFGMRLANGYQGLSLTPTT